MKGNCFMKTVTGLAICAMLLTGTLKVGAAQAGNKSDDAADGIVLDEFPATWNPHEWATAADGMMFHYIVTPLVDSAPAEDGYEYFYMAATAVTDITADFEDREQWGIDGDEMYVYQIDLNPQLTWDDGEPIDADTYIYSMKTLIEPGSNNLRADGYVNGGLGQNAIRGAFGYHNSDKAGEIVYRNAVEMELDDDTALYVNTESPCFFFSGESIKTIHESSFAPFFFNDDGDDIYPILDSGGEFIELTDEIKDALSLLAEMFGDNNPEAWLEFCHAQDGVYEDTPWEEVGLLKTDDYQIVYILDRPVEYEDFIYPLRRNWIVRSELYEAGDYNTGAENTASYGPYSLSAFEAYDEMTLVKNESWYGWADGDFEQFDEGEVVRFVYRQDDVPDSVESDDDVTDEADTDEADNTEAKVHEFPFAFETEDLYGKTVTHEDLGEKEIFFVHLWATWCGPCVAEMADLAEIANKYGDRVGFLGLVLDYDTNRSGAAKLADFYSIPFTNVFGMAPGLEAAYEMLQSGYVPTTVIIDGEGDIIGEPIIGSHGLGYGSSIEEALKAVRK